MPNSLWSATALIGEPADARQRIAAQHARIRELLRRAQHTAESALDGNPPTSDAVASTIGDIRTVIEVHMVFEERVFPTVFRNADTDHFQDDAEWMREDHAKQRATLAGLHQEALARPDLPILAAKLAFLATWLLEDMVAEEERFLMAPPSPA